MSTDPYAAATHAPGAGLEPASWGRRLLALMLDWIACTFVAFAILGSERYQHARGSSWLVLGIFLLETGIGTALVSGSFGQLLTGIRVLRTDGQRLNLLLALLRSFFVCLVVPPAIFKPDGRGLHDLWTGSGAYRLPSRTR
jgi:uncharacterized RDD family membrane protein YckC